MPRLAFPDDSDLPPQFPQCGGVSPVPGDILFELCLPELDVAARSRCEAATPMAMPEAAMDEYNGAPPREHNVRFTREVPPMEPESEACRVKQRPNHPFRCRVSRPDP